MARFQILNIWVDALSREDARQRAREILRTGSRPHSIFASNPEKNFSVPKLEALYDAYRHADMLLPDGIGMVMALRLLHGVKIQRIAGSDFIFDLCAIAEEEGYSVYIYGAKEHVNERAAAMLQRRYPGLKIAGRANGYVSEADMDGLVGRINASKADILFIALGSPKQELWFARHGRNLRSVRVCQGIGGTLDTIAGNVRRATAFWQRCSLEWFYRLITEPKRIRRQYLLPLFAFLVVASRLNRLVRRSHKFA